MFQAYAPQNMKVNLELPCSSDEKMADCHERDNLGSIPNEPNYSSAKENKVNSQSNNPQAEDSMEDE